MKKMLFWSLSTARVRRGSEEVKTPEFGGLSQRNPKENRSPQTFLLLREVNAVHVESLVEKAVVNLLYPLKYNSRDH